MPRAAAAPPIACLISASCPCTSDGMAVSTPPSAKVPSMRRSSAVCSCASRWIAVSLPLRWMSRWWRVVTRRPAPAVPSITIHPATLPASPSLPAGPTLGWRSSEPNARRTHRPGSRSTKCSVSEAACWAGDERGSSCHRVPAVPQHSISVVTSGPCRLGPVELQARQDAVGSPPDARAGEP